MKSWERKFRVLNMGCVTYSATLEHANWIISKFGGVLLEIGQPACIGEIADNTKEIGGYN